VGAPAYDGGLTDEGKCFLYYGKSKPPASTANWYSDNAVSGCDFAVSVAGAGDVNGDGYADIMVGAPLFDNGQIDEGRVFIYHGKSHNVPNTTADRTLESNLANVYFGNALASAGDVNADGYDDIIIASVKYNNFQGRVYGYYGSATGIGTISDWGIIPSATGARFGESVSGAGDLNGDGYADIIIGAPYYPNGNAAGRAYVYYGSATGLTTSNNWKFICDQDGAYLGISVAGAGDVNRDGYSDVIIGASGYDNGETNEGRVYVFYGSYNGVRSASPWIMESNQEAAFFGQSVSTAGDTNGDGFSDVIIGAPYYDNGNTDEGVAFVYPGGPIGLFNVPIALLDGANQDGAWFGYSVAGAGDVNGDGFSDVIVGAYKRDNRILFTPTAPSIPIISVDAGSAYIFAGSSTGPTSESEWAEHFIGTNANFGRCVAGAGDVNGDGFADVIIGAPGYVSDTQILGRAYLYLGGGGNGRTTKPSQLTNFFPYKRISHLSKSDNNEFSFSIATYSPFGQGGLGYEFEVKEFPTPLDGTNTVIWKTYGYITGVTRFFWDLPVNQLYHWRARVLYDPVTLPYQSHGPWITIPWNGMQEADLRTGPNPIPTLQDIINYLLGRNHYPRDINTDGKNDAADVVKFLLP
jgi:hypothetical protein